MNLRKIGSLLLMFAVLICPLVVYGDGGGVEVNPAYITGRIILNGYTYTDVASSANVYANATGNFNSNVQVSSDGSYTLTVNTPADGSPRTYNVYARVYLKSGAQFDAGATVQIATVRGETYTQNFSQSLATLTVDGSFTNDDWTYLSPYYNSGSSQYLYFYMSVSKTGTHSFLIPANIPFRWVWGSASPKDTNKYTSLELVKKEFTAQPGETVELNWTGTFPDKPVQQYGTVRGSISFSPLPEGALSQHYLYCSPTSVSITKDGAYRLDNAYAGTQYSYFVSYFNNNRQYLYWPYRYINPNNYNGYIDVPANGEVVINISDTPAMVKGKLSLTGIKSLSDTSSTVQVYASGVSNTNTYGGQAYDSGINKNTGEYSLYLTPGTWDVGYYTSNIYFNNNSSNPANYMYTYFTYYDYTRLSSYNGGVTVAAGQVVEGYDIEIPTGMVTMKFISTDGSLIKSPYIQGSMSEIVNGKTIHFCNVYGNGSSQEVQEAQVTFIAPPGTYTLNTQAIVNGSNVTFSPQSVVVVEGVHTVIEVNGPKLTLNSPVAELYTYDQQITVSGTATDDVLVKSVTLNGQNLSIQPTGNPNDPHEVSFETTIPLVNGPNKIEVVATDSANKVASDTRFVYKDNAVPTLTVTPTNGTVTSATAITLMGTATDDNQITKLTVNGLSVDFYSTNNPEDPNEVYFSKTYNLVKGANRFSVTAYDNCKRSTTVLNIITSADEDTVPPVFAPIQAITLELATSQGTAYTLTKPAVTDNIDPKPQVTSDAPAVFPLGTTQVTWKATDAMGNTATAIQNVIVVDTTKPVLTVPADLTIEATGKKTLVDIGQATASDLTAVMIISDAPEDGAYSLGTTIVTWTATDANGNVVIGTQTITVVDTTKPILDVPADINVEATDIKTPVNIGQATGSDIFPITITSDAPADGKYSLGTTVVTWTATDANGNEITGTQTITVVDTTKPVLNIPANMKVEATDIKTPVNIGQATGSDIFPVTITSDAPADGTYSLGTTVVTWTATDANGNELTGTQTITVVDTTQPVLNIPANMKVEATDIKTPVNIGQATGSDIFPVTITSDAPADGTYSLGTTIITWTATDANGNVVIGTQTITVVDTTKPILDVPADINVEATDIKTPVNIGQATGSDIFSVTITSDAPADGKYSLGTTVVTWTATDANGNKITGAQTITVVDSTQPVLDVPADINVEATAIKTPVNIGQATGSDIFPVTITSDAPADGKYSLGTTVVTWTAADANGNEITGTQTITVVDTTQPVLNIPANMRVEATAIKTPVNIGQAAGSDIFPVTITSDAPADGKYSLGTTVVTWTATDANGNVTTATQKITVVDTTKPILNVPANIIIKATGAKTFVNIGQATATDIFAVTIVNNAPTDGKYTLGTTIVTWTATDANGNQASGTQRITVVGSAMAQQLLHYGGIEVNQFNSNGAISIYGSCRANLLSTTKSAVLITSNANQVGTILTNQPIGAIPLPNLPVLTGKTTIPTSVPPNPTLTNNRFEKSTMISSTVKINGLLVVKGDLTINGNVTLNNAAIYCTGKITVSGSINGSGLIYAGAGFTHYGNLQLSGSLLVNGTWEVSGTTKITDDNNQSYLEYLIF